MQIMIHFKCPSCQREDVFLVQVFLLISTRKYAFFYNCLDETQDTASLLPSVCKEGPDCIANN